MKRFAFALPAAFALMLSTAHAAQPTETGPADTWTEIATTNPNQLVFDVSQAPDGNGQAAEYTGAEKIAALYERLLNNSGSAINRVVAKTMAANGCKIDGSYKQSDMGFGTCGFIPSPTPEQNTVLASYGRGGWASAGATYWSFHTFTSDGTGRFTEPVFAAEWSVGVEAQSESIEEGKPTVFRVTIEFKGLRSTAADKFRIPARKR